MGISITSGTRFYVNHEEIIHMKEALERFLKQKIIRLLSDVCAFRSYSFSPEQINMELRITQVQDKSARTMVIAVYKAEIW